MPFIRHAFVRLKARMHSTDTCNSRPCSTSRLPADITTRICTSAFYPSMSLFRSGNAVHRCTQLFILNILCYVVHKFFLIALHTQQILCFCLNDRLAVSIWQFNASATTIQPEISSSFINFGTAGISLLFDSTVL